MVRVLSPQSQNRRVFMVFLVYCIVSPFSCMFSCSPTVHDILYSMARYSLFVMKVPIKNNKPNQTNQDVVRTSSHQNPRSESKWVQVAAEWLRVCVPMYACVIREMGRSLWESCSELPRNMHRQLFSSMKSTQLALNGILSYLSQLSWLSLSVLTAIFQVNLG